MTTALIMGQAVIDRPVAGEEPMRVRRTIKRELSRSEVEIEASIVERARQGDLVAFRKLVDTYEQRVHAIAMSVLGNPDDAADVAQEAFLKVFRKLPSFRGQSSFYTWLYRIVFNLSVDLSRKRYRSRERGFAERGSEERGVVLEEVSASEFSGSIADPGTSFDRAELQQGIQSALGSLSAEHRAVITLREVDGLSYSEISAVTGISKGTVMSRLHHARKKLQRVLVEFAAGRSDEAKSSVKGTER